jgi:radical SAM family uncharacterized protein/radical SAM-linked protein
VNIDEILPLVSRPSRYLGNEFNIIRKDWRQAALRVALIFPDLYEIGMSHQGLQILYHLLNDRDDLLAERAYCPAPDLEKILRDRDLPLFSLESHQPLAEFDVLGITLPYELCYTNILTILDLAGLPFRSIDRDENHPLVIGGGPCAFHPEPVADFFDAILLGDGEEAILEIADLLKKSRDDNCDRQEVLSRLATIDGLYVPSFFTATYDDNGNFGGMSVKEGVGPVRRRILADIEDSGGAPPLVPLARIVHDRLGIEIARGCTRGCRFCQAGIIYRPVRERSPERILELADKGIAESGFDELALLSLSTGDYSCISELMISLMNRLVGDRVSVSMPSMRVGTLTPEIMDQIKRVRKSGFTLAPEAGTDRLRQVINKGISEEDLLTTSKAAFELGWKLLKFYFMFGLPTETDDDLNAIPALVQKALQSGGKGGGRRINVSVAPFVPKPHTPFQREKQLGVEEGFSRIDMLKKAFRGKNIQLKWHDPRGSFIEGVMSRGDRRLAALVEDAWHKGARLDAWNEHFRLDTWLEVAEARDMDLSSYLRKRRDDEPLPWDHLDCGVDLEFIEEERRKADEMVYTPDCRVHGCQKCGLCDFKTIKPLVMEKCDPVISKENAKKEGDEKQASTPEKPFVYRISYNRLGLARFLGHLELIQVFYRVLRKVGMPMAFSQGYNPSPRVTFSPALPLGTESKAEYLLVDLVRGLKDRKSTLADMNNALPTGFEVTDIALGSGRVEQRLLTCYHVSPGVQIKKEMIDSFIAKEQHDISVIRKGRKRTIDARPLVKELVVTGEAGELELHLLTETGQAALKPLEIIAGILGMTDEEKALARVMKMWCREA